ncbi:MAG TPA: hypothetical protein VFF33_10280 [Ignavibacteriaceae bacterium]|nr:hypothetical protein [Ignavibacteriaceae bacterium]
MKKIIIILFGVISILNAQENKQQYEYAVSLFNNEKYFDAITEFKRLLFFDSSGTYNFQAYIYMGNSYKEGGHYQDAINYFVEAEKSATNQKELFNAKVNVIRSNLLRGSYLNAKRLILKLDNDPRYDSLKDEINYWYGWNYMMEDKWDSAAFYFNKMKNKTELEDLARKTQDEKYNKYIPKIMSIFIPGSGQIYTGNYLSGLMSLGWNALFGYLTVNSIIENRVFDGVMIANFLWLRFYTGNIENSNDFVEEKNREITNHTYLYLQDTYNGIKP